MRRLPPAFPARWRAVAVVVAVLSTLLAGGCDRPPADGPGASATTATALVRHPAVIAHRGASGYRPEHTLAAYELAVRQGADAIEPDLVMTRDGVLVDRHEPEISQTTDVAGRPALAALRRTRSVDGKDVTGWFVQDLTLAQLRTVRARERIPTIRPGSAAYDGRFGVPTFDEVLDLRARLSAELGRQVQVVPELKHPTSLHRDGLDPETAFMAALRRHDLAGAGAPVLVQCFEPTSLRTLRSRLGYRGRSLLLVGPGSPWDLASAGDGRRYSDLLTPAGLSALRPYVDAIGPDKSMVLPVTPDGRLGEATSLLATAHAAGLQVIPYTFRAENRFLPPADRRGADPDAAGRFDQEVTAFLHAGVDGLFCDQPDLCVQARTTFSAGR